MYSATNLEIINKMSRDDFMEKIYPVINRLDSYFLILYDHKDEVSNKSIKEIKGEFADIGIQADTTEELRAVISACISRYYYFKRMRKYSDADKPVRQFKITTDESQPQYIDVMEYDDHVEVVSYIHNGGDKVIVVIPSVIFGKEVTVIRERCFMRHTEITEISLPDTLKEIGFLAFAGCGHLRGITIPDNVSEIGHYAFADCFCGGTVKLPADLRILRGGVFSHCRIDAMTANSGLRVIESHAFYDSGCFELNIPDSVEEIRRGAFSLSAVKVNTSLPYSGWYHDWPYGEKIRDSQGNEGIIKDYHGHSGKYYILKVEMDSGSTCRFFFPSMPDSPYVFVDDHSQKMMEEYDPDVARVYYKGWLRGFI